MKLIPVQSARRALVVVGAVAYPVLAHYSTAAPLVGSLPALGLLVALAPVLAVLVWLVSRVLPRWFAGALLCAAVVALLWWLDDDAARYLGPAYFVQHVAVYLALGAAFGLSLTPSRCALCTRAALALRGRLSPEEARYTRQITAAWALFFLGVSLVSTLLFMTCRIEVWSVFANFLSPVLIALMFVVEHRVRRLKLPDVEHFSIMASVLAFRNSSKAGSSATAHPR